MLCADKTITVFSIDSKTPNKTEVAYRTIYGGCTWRKSRKVASGKIGASAANKTVVRIDADSATGYTPETRWNSFPAGRKTSLWTVRPGDYICLGVVTLNPKEPITFPGYFSDKGIEYIKVETIDDYLDVAANPQIVITGG